MKRGAIIIGEKIKKLRLKNDLTQEELANKLNTTKQNIYKYESGIITNIPSDKIEKLAEILHTTPAYLMGWEDNNDDDEQRVFSEVDDMTNELFEKHKLLFSKTKNASVNDMKKIIAIVDTLMGGKDDE